ncbi:MAG: dihydroneopterin aldolase [Paludibacter sp.]|nr:dihydroneopterin aldolase [Paludibacter sp.]
MSKIILENMEFHAFHGVMEHENQLGNTFLVSIGMDVNTEIAGRTDNLHDTLNYQSVYNVVKNEMIISSKLIEHIGQRILDSVFNKFPEIETLEVTLSKLNPPLGGKVEKVTIELYKSR